MHPPTYKHGNYTKLKQIKLFTAKTSLEIALKYTKMTKSKKTSKTRQKNWLPNETKNNNTSSQMFLDHYYAFGLLL